MSTDCICESEQWKCFASQFEHTMKCPCCARIEHETMDKEWIVKELDWRKRGLSSGLFCLECYKLDIPITFTRKCVSCVAKQ